MSGIDTHDFDLAFSQQKREHACSTADVQHMTRTELLRHLDVRVEIAAIWVEWVVDRGELWMTKTFVCHAAERKGR
ncbi:protein of unknown function [Streptomyces sp. KY75]|nr:protein of unknown function [Streptomyces sp. KY70]CAD5977893.1 protein of unknown function [Streptomyces sp. KY75]